MNILYNILNIINGVSVLLIIGYGVSWLMALLAIYLGEYGFILGFIIVLFACFLPRLILGYIYEQIPAIRRKFNRS